MRDDRTHFIAMPNWRRASAAVAISTMVLTGCTTTQGPTRVDPPPPTAAATSGSGGPAPAAAPAPGAVPMTPDEQRLRDQAQVFNETVAGGVVTGMVVGALLGGLLGALSGGKNDIGRGIAMGAAAGGIMGGADGYLTAKAQESANNRVRMLNSMTKDVAADNVRLAKMVESSKAVLKADEDRLTKLNAEYEQNKISLNEARAEKARIEQNRDLVQKTVSSLQERRDKYLQAQAKVGPSPDFDNQIALLNKQIAELSSSVDAMNAALKVSKV